MYDKLLNMVLGTFFFDKQQFWKIVVIKNKTFNMQVWNMVAQYLFLKKKDPNAPKSELLGYMHGINRISIFMFLAGLIIFLIKMMRA